MTSINDLYYTIMPFEKIYTDNDICSTGVTNDFAVVSTYS